MPLHPMLKTDYTLPYIPAGFDQACAFYYSSSDCVLDFVNHNRRDFASETSDVDIEWPFIEGFIPRDNDWIQIGFFPLHA
jgi:hypothetical protein